MLLSLVVESTISCFGRIFRAPHRLGGYIAQKPLQSRLPLSQQPHGQGPLLPRDPASQARNPPQSIFSAGSPVPHHRSGASWGPRCSGRVPCDRRSSSQRQEKLVPWSSLLGCTVNMTSAGSPFPTGCRPSSSSPWSNTTERWSRGALPDTRQLRLSSSPTSCQRGRGASSTHSGNPAGERGVM